MCVSADIAEILLVSDWPTMVTVSFYKPLCRPIRVVWFVCVSRLRWCSIILGCLNPLHILLVCQTHAHCGGQVAEYLVQCGDLAVPVSVMDMALVSALLAFAVARRPPLGARRPVLLN